MKDKPLHPGQRLRERLEPAGLTVTESAKRLGVTRQTLNNLLNGKTGISAQMAMKLQYVFKIPPETLQQWQTDYELGQARTQRARSAKVRGEWFLLSSGALIEWADTLDARYTLPRLVRMLIRNTADPSCTADFRAMEDSQGPGWDGRVSNPIKNEFVPSGPSAWELSAEANPQAKAERDYRKRTQDPLDINPATTTLVFVSLRRWTKKRQWSAEKNREGTWKKVIAYDASDIEQWLEINPEISVWLARRIGILPPGVRSLESFWEEYRNSTEPALGPELLLAGRSGEVQRLLDWLQSGVGVFRLSADSPDEALAFLAATTETNAALLRDELARTIIVEDPEHVRHLMTAPRPLTFVWQLDDPTLLGTVVDHRHRALVPLGRGALGAEHADADLQRPPLSAFVAALKCAFEDNRPTTDHRGRQENDRKAEEKANSRATRSGRSISFYRLLYPAGGIAKPPHWATPIEAGSLVPLLLAGSWSESNPADKETIARLSGNDYSIVSRFLARLKNMPDAPVRQVGDTWTLLAPLPAWLWLANFIDDSAITRFRSSVLEVLGERDPKLDLDADRRWMAGLYKKEFTHSSALRKGLADSLIFLAVVASQRRPPEDQPVNATSDLLVWKLIGENPGKERWASLSDVLPFLAEAAPVRFLDAVGKSLSMDNPDILSLFEPEDRPLGGGARHPSLLWALEILAWFPEHLSRVARVLAKLARLDPGGKLANQPDASLKAIFCNWHTNTAASLDDRLQTLDMLIDREPEEAWKLLLELLPGSNVMGTDTAEPRWRPKPEKNAVTNAELWRANTEILKRVIDAAGTDPARLRELIGRTTNWPPDERARFVGQLRQFTETSQDVELRTTTWKELRDFIALERIRKTLSDADLKPLLEVMQSLQPTDTVERYAWLFNTGYPYLEDGETDDTAQRMADVDKRRIQVASSIISTRGTVGLLALALRAEFPGLIGAAAAEAELSDPSEIEILETALGGQEVNLQNMGIAFVGRRRHLRGQTWSDSILRSDRFRNWSTARQAHFCLGLPSERPTWKTVTQLGYPVEDLYWTHFRVFIGTLCASDAEFAIAKLLASGRAGDALEQGGAHPEKLTTRTLADVLNAVIDKLSTEQHTPQAGTMFRHYVERIFHKLRESGDLSTAELGRLEWQYLPVFRFSERPVTLHNFLRTDANFFAEVVKHAFREEVEEQPEKEIGQHTRNLARAAFSLLSSWHTHPGRQDDGTVDTQALCAWVAEARRVCASNNQSKVGDRRIGEALSNVPNDPDGLWPHKAVRDLVERTESGDLESGLRMGKFNSRGVWTKTPSEAGRPERELAKGYRAAARALGPRWPRTATVLSALADNYDGLARHSDIIADELDLL